MSDPIRARLEELFVQQRYIQTDAALRAVLDLCDWAIEQNVVLSPESPRRVIAEHLGATDDSSV